MEVEDNTTTFIESEPSDTENADFPLESEENPNFTYINCL
jgi:hypothetical protein